jgi:hypothetical protein
MAGTLLLIFVVKQFLFPQHSHIGAVSVVARVSASVVAVFCFWHAFRGRDPLIGTSEVVASRSLATLSFLFAAILTLTWAVYQRNTPELVTVVAFYAAGVFFCSQVVRNRPSTPTS